MFVTHTIPSLSLYFVSVMISDGWWSSTKLHGVRNPVMIPCCLHKSRLLCLAEVSTTTFVVNWLRWCATPKQSKYERQPYIYIQHATTRRRTSQVLNHLRQYLSVYIDRNHRCCTLNMVPYSIAMVHAGHVASNNKSRVHRPCDTGVGHSNRVQSWLEHCLSTKQSSYRSRSCVRHRPRMLLL